MKQYIKPVSATINLNMEQMIATSPSLKDELGSEDQLSNSRSGWDNPEWAEEE